MMINYEITKAKCRKSRSTRWCGIFIAWLVMATMLPLAIMTVLPLVKEAHRPRAYFGYATLTAVWAFSIFLLLKLVL
jgi:hypothetical protein